MLLLPLPGRAESLKVGLFRKQPPTSVMVKGPCVVEQGGEKPLLLGPGKTARLTCTPSGVRVERVGKRASSTVVRLLPTDGKGTVNLSPDRGSFRTYRGRLDVRTSGGKLLVVSHIGLEDYVRGVLPGEMPSDWPDQALAAQAVVIRSFAVSENGRHAREGFDLCDLTHCQVYRGASWERPKTDAAVRATEGMVLSWQGKSIPAPYHSTCGGMTTDGFYAGHSPEPYLKPVADPYCRASTHYSWSCVLSPEHVRRALEGNGRRATKSIVDIRATERDTSGRVKYLLVDGARVSGNDFLLAAGRNLGWNKIKSTKFTVSGSGGGFAFTGKGLGHGMGLCQWGAKGMALKGWSYRRILEHFFPKCTIQR